MLFFDRMSIIDIVCLFIFLLFVMTLTIHAIEDIVCLNDDVKKTLRQFGDFVMHETMSDADIVNMCHDADIIITKKKKISADVVRALPHLKYIVTLSA